LTNSSYVSYTQGEGTLLRTIDSLVTFNYDDKRKLMFIICDGKMIGSGNDRTTPLIGLDILGVDTKVDPEPLLCKSVSEGFKQLNYGKVHSVSTNFSLEPSVLLTPQQIHCCCQKPTERSILMSPSCGMSLPLDFQRVGYQGRIYSQEER
jgi:chitin synthase